MGHYERMVARMNAYQRMVNAIIRARRYGAAKDATDVTRGLASAAWCTVARHREAWQSELRFEERDTVPKISLR